MSRSKPIDFVITWRNLLAFASASLIEPALQLLRDPRVIVGELAQLAIAEHVAAAIARVDDVRRAAVDEHRGQRRAHAAQLGLRPRGLEDRRARAPHDAAHQLERRREHDRGGTRHRRSSPRTRDRSARRQRVAGRRRRRAGISSVVSHADAC